MNGLGKPHVDKMCWSTAEAEGEVLAQWIYFKPLDNLLMIVAGRYIPQCARKISMWIGFAE